ncbi:LIM-like homeobox protein [Fusarium heterosporum]|uniref:LIM-like homeobox protein n=1 Tax=Fusarium heterosporum TaxID=42747 RepID=A0A8H5TUZ3_FUSHE|nr:LIM-like homeobox protein [Fusarium heterosporum]
MATITSLLVAYVLGGLTFIPLVVVSVLAFIFYTSPVLDDAANEPKYSPIVDKDDDTIALDTAKRSHKKDNRAHENDLDVAAGFFAVCREYTPMGINAKPIERSTPVGSATVAPSSPSVYQTMYRSIFERKPTPGPMDNNNNSTSQRPKNAGNVFYVVLRHGHLMLFDDEEQAEVRHVVSLAYHEVSIYSGGDVTPEGELFIKRNAIRLSRKQAATEPGAESPVSKPFYLFSENCSAKEDFYFALIKNQEQSYGADGQVPKPLHFDVKNIISLVQKLHSTEENVHSRWLNALIGRVFLGVNKTKDIETFIREKLTKKISRVKRPAFLTNITINGIDTGEAAPYFSNFKLRDLTVEGECVVEADVKYSGNARIEIAATAKIDLGARFKAREVNLVLAAVLKRAEGHMLFKIKPPPSNRIWVTFQSMPKMEMDIEPIVSARQITYTVILRQIENRIKEVIAETVVLPFWDDMPFFKTEHKHWRGGIFEGDDATVTTGDAESIVAAAGDVGAVRDIDGNPDLTEETRPLEKSQTVPVMEPAPPPTTGLFGRRLSRAGTNPQASASSTSVDSKGPSASPVLRPKISKTSLEPVVGTDVAHADIFKPSTSPPDNATNFMAVLNARSNDASPRPPTATDAPLESSSASQQSNRSSRSSSSVHEAVNNGVSDDAQKTPVAMGRRNTTSSTGSGSHTDERPGSSSASMRESIKSQTGSLGRSFFTRREHAEIPTHEEEQEETSHDEASQDQQHSQAQSALHKQTTLAAVSNAALQAKQWGWNAFQRHKEARRQAEQANHLDLTQPMGRGQPLPPPGTPLPKPTNGMTRIAPPSGGVPTRKPVPQSAARSSSEFLETHHEHNHGQEHGHEHHNHADFRPPLPQRGRRRQSHAPEPDNGQNILVVAAPQDSQPATPSGEYPSNHQLWASSDEQTVTDSGTSHPPSVLTNESSLIQEDNKPPSHMGISPAVPAVADDDEDFSGWMDNEPLDTEINDSVPPITQEVK